MTAATCAGSVCQYDNRRYSARAVTGDDVTTMLSSTPVTFAARDRAIDFLGVFADDRDVEGLVLDLSRRCGVDEPRARQLTPLMLFSAISLTGAGRPVRPKPPATNRRHRHRHLQRVGGCKGGVFTFHWECIVNRAELSVTVTTLRFQKPSGADGHESRHPLQHLNPPLPKAMPRPGHHRPNRSGKCLGPNHVEPHEIAAAERSP